MLTSILNFLLSLIQSLFPSRPEKSLADVAVRKILKAVVHLQTECPYARFVADRDCTIEAMETKARREEYSEKLHGDRFEVERQLRARRPKRREHVDRVAKWIVRCDYERADADCDVESFGAPLVRMRFD